MIPRAAWRVVGRGNGSCARTRRASVEPQSAAWSDDGGAWGLGWGGKSAAHFKIRVSLVQQGVL
eukprot:4230976-Lingulodinium_polyedra.AAC.1